MAAATTFFPVDNGDMTLITLESGRTILVDINIRAPGDDIRDVSADLRSRLKTDADGRPYVDAMLLSHPDQDHCRGLVEHFHLGKLAGYKFRRAKKDHTLCDDATAWKEEARRRVAVFRTDKSLTSGDRIQILGEDEDGKTDDLTDILVIAGNTITKIDGTADTSFRGRFLAPKGKGTAEEEERRSKNHSSVIVRFSIAHGNSLHACRFLSGGEVVMRKSLSGSACGQTTRQIHRPSTIT